MIKVAGRYLNETPVLFTSIVPHKIHLDRCSAITYDFNAGLAYFPCFPPFHREVLHDLKAIFGDSLELTEGATKLVADAEAMVANYEAKKLPVGFSFKTKPFKHQVESLLYALYHPRSALLLGCGAGKSKVAVDLINVLRKKTLVLLPPSLISNWVEEINRHSSRELVIAALDDATAKKKKEKLAKIADADVLLVGYETASRYYEDIWKSYDYSVVICDEAHKLKGWSSQRTKAAIELAKKGHYRTLLTGTMSLGKPEDVYSQLHLLSPSILGQDYYKFLQNFVTYAAWNAKIPVGVKNLDRLNKVIRKYSIRYDLDDCVDLPERRTITTHVDMSSEQWKLYKAILSADDLVLDEGIISKEHRIAALGKLGQVTSGFLYISQKDPNICDGCQFLSGCLENGVRPYTTPCKVVTVAPPNKIRRLDSNPKLDRLMSLLEEINLGEGNKTIVWVKFTEEVAMIEEALQKEGLRYAVLRDDPLNDIRSFEEDQGVRVLLGPQAMGVGFTANAANYAIFFSLSFSLEHVVQSMARNRRIGQDRKQSLFFLVARNTIDERVVNAIETKTEIVESLLSSLSCLRCDRIMECSARNIQIFEPGCILKKKFTTR